MRARRLAVAFMALGVASAASALDLHQFWDQRCHECHGHAGDFARRHFKVEKGELVGPHRRSEDLKTFMGRHEMGPQEVDGVYAMLLAQATTQPVYQQKCAGCHQTAAELARASVARRDGVVVVRGSGQSLSDLLQRHGKLSREEIPVVLESLVRVLGEVEGASRK